MYDANRVFIIHASEEIMIDNPIVLTIDCGTQSVRSLLIDSSGNILYKAQYKLPPCYSTELGWAEQKPSVYWDAIVSTAKEAISNNQQLVPHIVAITITTVRNTVICMDKDGNELCDFLMWMDCREAQCPKPLPLLNRIAFNLVGLGDALAVQRRLTRSNWIQENRPDVWQNTYKFGVFSSWLTYRLTGEFKDSVGAQQARIPYDYKKKVWKGKHDLQYPIFNVPQSKLVELVDVGDVVGYITAEVSQLTGIPQGLPLIATGSDKGCETIGTGILDEKGAGLSFGTAASVQLTTHKYVEPLPLLPAYTSVIKGMYNPETQVESGYWMVRWFVEQFGAQEVLEAKQRDTIPEVILNEKMLNIPVGCEGLMLQPFWTPALKTPEARGSIVGFSSHHTRLHLYRAIIEGIGFALYDGMRNLEKRTGIKVEYVTVGGGGSQSDIICQLTADMFGLPVKRIQTYEASGLGSSMVAFVNLGVFDSFGSAVKSMVRYKDVFTPDQTNHKIYSDLYNDVYKKLYKQLRPLYMNMRKRNKKK